MKNQASYLQAPFGGGVIRTADGAHIPQDTNNADWRAYLEQAAADAATPDLAQDLDASAAPPVQSALSA